jgi:hypothetical protein
MKTRYRGWLAVVLLIVPPGVACSAPPSYIGPSTDAGPGTSVTTACTSLATAECTELASCSNVLLETRYGTLATCQTRLEANCVTALMAPSSGNSADQVQACAVAYSTWSCSDYLGNVNVPAACAQRTGALANGLECVFPAQCMSGFCALSPNAACGTCATAPMPGDSCAGLSSCGQRLVCLEPSKVCGTLGTLAASCSTNEPCGAHLSCIGSNSAKGVLGKCETSVAAVGAKCDPTLVTGPGCDYDADLTCNAQSKTCQPLAISPGGGPCGSVDHQFATCLASGECSTTAVGDTGTCTPAAADGEACSATTAGPACVPPARCILTSSGSSGICQEDSIATCK